MVGATLGTLDPGDGRLRGNVAIAPKMSIDERELGGVHASQEASHEPELESAAHARFGLQPRRDRETRPIQA